MKFEFTLYFCFPVHLLEVWYDTNFFFVIWAEILRQSSAGNKVLLLFNRLFRFRLSHFSNCKLGEFNLFFSPMILQQKSGKGQVGDGQQGERPPECKQQ